MEPTLECILSLLDAALGDLEEVGGSDFFDLIGREVGYYDRITKSILEICDRVSVIQPFYEELITKLEKWNSGLRNLIEKIHSDVDLQRITKLQCNTVINLSNNERNALTLKKNRRMKDLKLEIDKLIIKLDEFVLSFEESYSIANNSGSLKEESSDIIQDVEERYNAAIIAEQNQWMMSSQNTFIPNEFNKVSMQESIDDVKDKENKEKYENIISYKEETPKECRENFITDFNNNSNVKDFEVSENKMTKMNTLNDFTENLLESLEVQRIQQKEKEKAIRKYRDELLEPTNWTRYRYSDMYGEFTDMDLGCMISSFKGALRSKDNIVVHLKSIDDIPIRLDSTYEVLSNVVQIEPASLDVEFDNDIPWRISVPYLMIRNASKEVVVVCYDMTSDNLMILETTEIIFDDNKEGGFKLAEASLPSASVICVVVSKRKIERFKVDKKGTKFVSNIDPRVVLNVAQNCVKIKVNIELSVLQIENGHLNDLLAKNTLGNLHAMSPVIDIRSDYSRNLLRTCTLQIPIPNTLSHSSRGRAVSARSQVTDKVVKRSKSAITRQISTEEDPVIKVGIYNSQEKMWRANNSVSFIINKNKDAVEIELQNLYNQRIVVVRCDDNFNDDHLYRSIDVINKNLETRIVQTLIRQHALDPNRIVVVIASPNRLDKIQKYLTQENFSEETSLLSLEFTIQERSKLKIHCKGNLEIIDHSFLVQSYNSQLLNRKEFWVKEIDKFAQKSKDSFQGFIVISEILQNNSNKLWEAVINIPKIDFEDKKGLKMIKDFDFEPTDIINKHYLRFLSQQLGQDWIALGKSLKVADVSIRRISNEPFSDNQAMAYQCLLKWIKNSTVYSKKTIIMEKALRSIGRFDLVQDLAKRVLNGR